MENKSYTDKQKFVLKMADKAFEMERERGKNLLNQSQRLLPMQTFLLTALTLVFSLLKDFKGAEVNTYLSAFAFVLTLVFSLISLALNVASQWGFKSNTIPVPNSVEENLNKHLKEKNLEFDSEMEYKATKELWNKIVADLRKVNNKKAIFLNASMIGLIFSIASFMLFMIPLVK